MVKKSPIPQGVALKLWNDFRDRWSINPAKFKTKDSLVNWIQKKNKGMARTIRDTNFWEHTKELYPYRTRSYTKRGRYIEPYARSRVSSWKSDEISVLTNLKVKDKLKGRTLAAAFNSYYPGRTSSSVLTKASRL